MKRFALLLLCSVCALPGGRAAAEPAQAARTREAPGFRIGVLIPLEGRYATLGESFIRGASIALKEARLKGIKNIELVVGDTRGTPLVCGSVADRLIAEERIDALLGEVLSSSTIAAAQVAELSRVVLLSPVATEEGIDEIGEWVFQTSVRSEVEIASLARMACGPLELRRLAYLSSDDPASRRGASLFADEIERLGARLVAAEFYPPGSTDFAEAIDRIRAADPEALFIGSETEDLILILPQLSYHEFGVQLLGTSSWESRRLIRMVGKDLEGAVFPADTGTRGAEQSFRSACALVNEEPGEINQVIIGAYQGTRMLLEALSRASSGGEPLREEMSRLLEKRRHPFIDLAAGDGIPFYTVRGERLVEYMTLRVAR